MQRNILVTLECFIEKDGKFLMLHRHPTKKIMPDVWMAPGGKREFNEGLFAAARREVMEETGLTIANLHVRAIGNAFLRDIDQEFHFHFVFADYVSGQEQVETDDGVFEWLTPEEITKKEKMLPEIAKVAKYIFDKTQPVISYTAVYSKGIELESFEIEAA
jgi:8-oxo-dGTP diphosphatase